MPDTDTWNAYCEASMDLSNQDDDIIRSKTIAKVTSTNVSCTYDDGSYCVPCVLMAC